MQSTLTAVPHRSATTAATLAHDLVSRAHRRGDTTAVAFTAGDGRHADLTYAALAGRACAFAEWLREWRGHLHDPQFVLIALPNGLDYVTAFYGCLAAGSVAVPFYPPGVLNARTAAAFRERLAQVVADCRPRVMVFPRELVDHVRGELAGLGVTGVRLVAADELPPPGPVWEVEPYARPTDLALLQYTSGSTTRPKGVMVTHDNLASNCRAMHDKLGSTEGEAMATWLPLFHDMGLIGTVAQPLMAGMTVHLTTPAAFVRRPLLWLRMATESRASLLMAPNFAYDLCVRGIPAADRDGLDLSAVRFAVNAAEPVRHRTLEAFAQAYAPYGFDATAFAPGYGMAEATLCVTLPDRRRDPALLTVSAEALRRGTVAPPADDEAAITLVGCGGETGGSEVAVVDPETLRTCPDGTVGELWTTGPSVTEGYWGLPDLTARELDASLPGDGRRYLRTGDLGVIVGGEVYVTGRIKDVIIHRGVNHYPQDLELTAEESHPALRPGGTAVFTVPGDDGEQIVLLCELNRYGDPDSTSRVLSAVRLAVAERHGVQVRAAAIVRKGQIPKTTSGKVRRGLSAQRWLDRDFDTVAVWSAREHV